jgi:hypothetical protein
LKDNVPTAEGEPQKSKVAPIGDTSSERRAESSQSIENLLAGLGSKAAVRAMPKAGSLAELPANQKLALREALLAASESHKEAETSQSELLKATRLLHQAERELSEKSQAAVRQSEDAAVQAAGLKKDLAAATAANQAYEIRIRKRTAYFWLALGAGTVAAIAGAILLPPLRPPLPRSAVVRLPPKQLAAPPPLPVPIPRLAVTYSGDITEQQALDRLDSDLAGLPLHEVSRALREANEWLTASGGPPCTVVTVEGDTSLLVSGRIKVNRGRDQPLAGAIERCADAVEHVIKLN